ncbi:unnamed protein product [Dracunculus medinensis]|uniref:RIBORED_LARGE domain-containing protein n=1 Tax=Dracunculus medinensis TaxID=318479 RepID=A0A0N4U3M0_DRAME|nr:unnamed protein product [Dracunculus medinensis]
MRRNQAGVRPIRGYANEIFTLKRSMYMANFYEIKTDVRQDCVLSPTVRTRLDNEASLAGIQDANQSRDFEYADNVFLFAASCNKMLSITTARTGFKISNYIFPVDETFMESSQNRHKDENPCPYSCNSLDLAIWLRNMANESGGYQEVIYL